MPGSYSEIRNLSQFTRQVFPLIFPSKNITRKMHVLSCVAPRQIREQASYYKMLKVEQKGEYIHCKFNELGRKFAPIKNKERRYFGIIREYENELYSDK